MGLADGMEIGNARIVELENVNKRLKILLVEQQLTLAAAQEESVIAADGMEIGNARLTELKQENLLLKILLAEHILKAHTLEAHGVELGNT